MAPQAAQVLAVLGLGLDPQPVTGYSQSDQTPVQVLGESPGRERGRVDPVDRRVELNRDDQVRRWLPPGQGALAVESVLRGANSRRIAPTITAASRASTGGRA